MRVALMAACLVAASLVVCHAEETGQVDVAGLIRAGDSALNSGDFDQAIASYEQALTGITDDSLKADVYFALSSVYLEKGVIAYYKEKDDTFYKKAMEYADMCLTMKPQSWRALANKGVIYMNTGDYAQSDAMFTEAEKQVQPDSPYFQQLMDQHAMVQSAMKLKELHESKQEAKSGE